MFFLRYALFIAGCILDITHIHALPHPRRSDRPVSNFTHFLDSTHPRPPDRPDWVFRDSNALSPPFPSMDKTVFDPPLAEPKPAVSSTVKLGWAEVACVSNYNSNKDREGNDVEKGEMVLIQLPRQPGRHLAVDALEYTKQLVDVGRTAGGDAAMIIRGRIGRRMEVELKERKAQHRENEVCDAVCDKVVYFATEYQVLYVGLDLSYHVLVDISDDPTKKPEITLLRWDRRFFITKGTPEDKIREYCHAEIQWQNYSGITQSPYR
ncbi:hypothetical protein F5051DRAFT_407973 [Lentinula edodes]|nr:hypothetical protein F5051DRAFT_407973 [Lentinula edodes]KAJ3893669.1 hypothetical protein GG344DRAFT_74814 [Lentinula edodes]